MTGLPIADQVLLVEHGPVGTEEREVALDAADMKGLERLTVLNLHKRYLFGNMYLASGLHVRVHPPDHGLLPVAVEPRVRDLGESGIILARSAGDRHHVHVLSPGRRRRRRPSVAVRASLVPVAPVPVAVVVVAAVAIRLGLVIDAADPVHVVNVIVVALEVVVNAVHAEAVVLAAVAVKVVISAGQVRLSDVVAGVETVSLFVPAAAASEGLPVVSLPPDRSGEHVKLAGPVFPAEIGDEEVAHGDPAAAPVLHDVSSWFRGDDDGVIPEVVEVEVAALAVSPAAVTSNRERFRTRIAILVVWMVMFLIDVISTMLSLA